MKKNLFFLARLTLPVLFIACSSSKKNENSDELQDAIDSVPTQVRCQGEPSNCIYEIQKICPHPSTYELIGKPIASFFSTEVSYKVYYKCIPAE